MYSKQLPEVSCVMWISYSPAIFEWEVWM